MKITRSFTLLNHTEYLGMRVTVFSLALLAAPSVSIAQQWPPPPPPDGQLPPPPPPPPDGQQPSLAPDQSQGGMVQQPDGTLVPMQPRRSPYNMVYGPEPDSSGARLTLAVTQGINGAALGVSFATLTGTESSGVYAGSVLLGSGIGLTSALVATRDGVTEGQVSAVNTGTLFGGLGALFLTLGVSRGISSRQAVGGIFAAGLTLGTTGGIVLALQRPRSGRVEFASSVGLWSAFAASHVFLAAKAYNSDSSPQLFGFSSLGALGAGLTVGAVLSQNVDISASRMRYINLAGLGGYIVIGLSAALFAADAGSDATLTAYSVGSIVGVGVGLALGTLLTNHTDDFWHNRHRASQQPRASSTTLMPGGPYATPGATLAGTF